MVSYKAKKNKNVFLLSSHHLSNILNESNKRKPETILYNRAFQTVCRDTLVCRLWYDGVSQDLK